MRSGHCRSRAGSSLACAPIGQTFDGAIVDKGFGVDGAFKVPSLRNVALTAPYFHNGDVLTLRQVVELYGRGGNVFPVNQLDGTAHRAAGPPGDAELRRDRRTRRLPGDASPTTGSSSSALRSIIRSSSCRTDIQETPTRTIDADGDGLADDVLVEIPAIGAEGGNPLPGFLEGIFGPTP